MNAILRYHHRAESSPRRATSQKELPLSQVTFEVYAVNVQPRSRFKQAVEKVFGNVQVVDCAIPITGEGEESSGSAGIMGKRPGLEKGDRHAEAGASASDFFEGAYKQGKTHGRSREYKPTSAGQEISGSTSKPNCRRYHEKKAGEVASGAGRPRTSRAETTMGASPCAAIAAADTSAGIASWISSAIRPDIPAQASPAIEYDPNSSRPASRCFTYVDGEKRYILAPEPSFPVGDTVDDGEGRGDQAGQYPAAGNAIPLGTIHTQYRDETWARGDRSSAVGGDGRAADGQRGPTTSLVKLPSGEMRMVRREIAVATIGQRSETRSTGNLSASVRPAGPALARDAAPRFGASP